MEQLSDNVFPSWWFDGYAGECEQEKVNCYCCDEKCDEDEIDTAYIYKEGLPHTVANTTSVKICKDCANSILSKATVDDVIAWGAESPMAVEINFVFANEFTAEQINEILERELRASVAVLGESAFKGSINDNKDDFVGWKLING